MLTYWQYFPDGLRRQEAFLSKLVFFFKSRAATAEEWDIALFRLSLSLVNFPFRDISRHSVQCWLVVRSAQCTCLDAWVRNIPIGGYQTILCQSTLLQRSKSRMLPDGQGDVAKDSLSVLQFILSLSETSQRAIQLSSFIHV